MMEKLKISQRWIRKSKIVKGWLGRQQTYHETTIQFFCCESQYKQRPSLMRWVQIVCGLMLLSVWEANKLVLSQRLQPSLLKASGHSRFYNFLLIHKQYFCSFKQIEVDLYKLRFIIFINKIINITCN